MRCLTFAVVFFVLYCITLAHEHGLPTEAAIVLSFLFGVMLFSYD